MTSSNENAMSIASASSFQHCIDALVQRLDGDDDANFWQIALAAIHDDSLPQICEYAGKDAIIIEIGRSSHWIRPHWTKANDGTRLPSGYNQTVSGYSFSSPPQFDWSLRWLYERESGIWTEIKGQPSRRPLTYRIAIPARTALHNQATISTMWLPGSPVDPVNKVTVIYGFERNDDTWRRFARSEYEHKS